MCLWGILWDAAPVTGQLKALPLLFIRDTKHLSNSPSFFSICNLLVQCHTLNLSNKQFGRKKKTNKHSLLYRKLFSDRINLMCLCYTTAIENPSNFKALVFALFIFFILFPLYLTLLRLSDMTFDLENRRQFYYCCCCRSTFFFSIKNKKKPIVQNI